MKIKQKLASKRSVNMCDCTWRTVHSQYAIRALFNIFSFFFRLLQINTYILAISHQYKNDGRKKFADFFYFQSTSCYRFIRIFIRSSFFVCVVVLQLFSTTIDCKSVRPFNVKINPFSNYFQYFISLIQLKNHLLTNFPVGIIN